jgi:hypothetical protein
MSRNYLLSYLVSDLRVDGVELKNRSFAGVRMVYIACRQEILHNNFGSGIYLHVNSRDAIVLTAPLLIRQILCMFTTQRLQERL